MKLYTIPAHRRGDTWDGIYSITLSINGTPINLTNCVISMELRESPDAPSALKFSTANNTIVILNALGGIIQIPPRKIEIPPGRYIYDLQIDFPNQQTKTYMSGSWEITFDVTE